VKEWVLFPYMAFVPAFGQLSSFFSILWAIRSATTRYPLKGRRSAFPVTLLDFANVTLSGKLREERSDERRLLIKPTEIPRRLTVGTDLLIEILSSESLLESCGPASPGRQPILGDDFEGGSG
jgi:hypothetical protein